MIVAVDTLFLSPRYRYTGTGSYLANLLPECLRVSESSDRPIEFRGFAPRGGPGNGNAPASPLFSVSEKWAAGHWSVWMLGGMALATWREQPDVVFLPTAHWAIPNPLTASVTTIHDAMPFVLAPGMVAGCRRLRWLTRINARLASRILTVSAWSKRDLVEVLGLDPGSIEVTYLGYDKRFYNDAAPDADRSAALLGRLGIEKPFVLHNGMVQLRKNLVRLIQAWERLQEGPGSLGTQLVLAGTPGPGHEQIREAAARSRKGGRIVLTGDLDVADMAALVKNASLVVIPSLYEGFCLPMVEAMACGVPTVASNSSCLPEVSGGVLEYFDPLSVEEMAEVMRRALEDSGLRGRLVDRGLERAAGFSWERCARESLEVFTKAAAFGPCRRRVRGNARGRAGKQRHFVR